MILNSPMGRRAFLGMLAGGAASTGAMFAATETGRVKKVKIAQFDAAGKRMGVVEVEKIVKSDEEWRKQLTPEQYQVTRKAGTERAFTGKYANSHEDGIYHCVCCDTPLFDSKTKFESGTGWPSFYQPLAKENVRDITDSSY